MAKKDDKKDLSSYTEFEKARLIGSRALQLSMGAPLAIKLTKKQLDELRYSTLEIAKLEFEKGVIPIEVRRPMPKEEYLKKNSEEEGTSEA